MSNTPEPFDAIIIGAGQSGGPLASALAGAGRKTALIEREHYGGTCVNAGCTPSKTIAASARVAYLARRADDYGVRTGDISVDMSVVRQRKRDIVESFRSGSEGSVHGVDNLEPIDGEARFTGKKTVTVTLNDGGERVLHADQIVINAGGRPTVPPIEGLNDVAFLDSTSVMDLAEVPDHLVIIGGGYVASEFAQMFRRFGARVTMLIRGDRLLAREDDEICRELSDILSDDGIDLRYETQTERVSVVPDGGVAVTISDADGSRELTGSHLLVATGRQPNTDRLNLEATEVEMDDRGYITTDDCLQTNVPGIYALGDIRGAPAFTHISYDDFRILRANLLDGGDRTITDQPSVWTVFTDPQLGRIGLIEREAREQGKRVRIAKMPMSSVARALETDETRGLIKAVVDADSDQILGASVLGVDGGEIAAMIQIAMMGNLPYTTLRDGVFSHPTFSEALNNLFSTFVDER